MRRRLGTVRIGTIVGAALSCAVPLAATLACSAASEKDVLTTRALDGGADVPTTESTPGDGFGFDVPGTDAGALLSDPKNCDEAAAYHTYVGCDYWPTVVANPVWSIFDFAVVVANAGDIEAEVLVTGPGGVSQTARVAPNSLAKIFLPWVGELKGPDCGAGTDPNCTTIPQPAALPSAFVKKGAYHLVSSRPVTVYQFNALEYKPEGGPTGKDWSECPGNKYCTAMLGPAGCYSYSNDASLLLPTTALTGTYRVFGLHGFSGPSGRASSAYFTITATQDGTVVTVKVSAKGKILAGPAVTEHPAGDTFTLAMNAGDVAQLTTEPQRDFDLSGSLVKASKPVQVLSGVPCIYNPDTEPACDHVEESVFPAETLGKRYVVATPTGPAGKAVGQVVKLYGNIDGTTLSYLPSAPPGAPSTLAAGEVVDLGVVSSDFQVVGSQPFGVATFMLAGKLVDPDTDEKKRRGDPSMTMVPATEQFRKKYVFLAPDDYDLGFVDVVAETGTTLTLDGENVSVTPKPIAGASYGIHRLPLGAGNKGAHVLLASKPVGAQVLGYGMYTSYQYPAGLDLARIAPPPPK